MFIGAVEQSLVDLREDHNNFILLTVCNRLVGSQKVIELVNGLANSAMETFTHFL